MQIKLLNNFIKAYEGLYLPSFDDSFEGKVKSICKILNEPFMHLSKNLSKELDELIYSLSKNINVAVIGQFSSGKSSLLNIILQKECLPTGAVPVTFKPTFLRYARDYFLRIEFEDGSDLLCDISELKHYTDQRNNVKEAKSLHIYAPVEILKNITLIDTPGLNANDTDTVTTFKELNSIHSLIWLSLIDNAGKKSEEDAIKANLDLLQGASICVLNQKDKLNESELENVSSYAKTIFSKYFNEVIAISCKEASDKNTYKQSNFDTLLNFLKNLDHLELKKAYTKRKILKICKLLENENTLFCDVFSILEKKFNEYENYLKEHFKTVLKDVKILNHQILESLKGISERISKEIFDNVKEKEAHFYKEASGFFKKNLYMKYDYKSPYISSDDVFLSMFYNSDVLNKEFKKVKAQLSKSFEELKDKLNNSFLLFQKEILLFKSRFSNIKKDDDFQSDDNFSEVRAFCNASEEYFLRDFENILFKNILDLELFLEKLNLKAFTNYENATKLSLGFFSRKINESRNFYELDSSQFSLYYPKKSEIYERVLTELNVHEFEALLINKPVISKVVSRHLEQNLELISRKKELISHKKNELEKNLKHILKAKDTLKDL